MNTDKIKIFVVARGGTSHESKKSHDYGAFVLDVLKKNKKETRDLYLHPNGIFTLDGLPIVLENKIPDFHFVWIALVGTDGEQNIISSLCEKYNVKYSGSSSLQSILASDKHNLKQAVRQHGIKTPYSYFAKNNSKKNDNKNAKDEALKIFGLVGIPVIIKPNNGSDSQHIDVATNYAEIEACIKKLFDLGIDAIAEKHVKGLPISVFVYSLGDVLHTNIISSEDFEYDKNEIRNEALYIHHILGFSDHAEYDFVVNEKGINLLEVNTHPHLLDHKYSKIWNGKNSLEKYILHKTSDLV